MEPPSATRDATASFRVFVLRAFERITTYTPGFRDHLMRNRRLLLLAVGLLLAQAMFIASVLPCQVCASESADDDCPPACEACVCCTMARVTVPPPADGCVLTAVGSVLPAPLLRQSPADAQDIFHVPRPSLS
jgi:hypothetical protein